MRSDLIQVSRKTAVLGVRVLLNNRKDWRGESEFVETNYVFRENEENLSEMSVYSRILHVHT